MRWKDFRLVALVAPGILVLGLLILRPLLSQTLSVKTYLTNALGLRAGAPVRLAGVEIGYVKTVRARPELKDAPVEVVMVLNPPYELRIPDDSIVRLKTAGVLGETFAEIDTLHASGPPLRANAVLKAQPTKQLE